ncbi:MAG: outer membrane protein [Novosphingobium sp.]
MSLSRIALAILALSAGLTAVSPARAEDTGLRAAAVAGLERTDKASGAGADDGFYYGAQLGYDWDLGGVIAGVEGEVGGSTARGALGADRARQGVSANAAVRLAIPLREDMRVFARGGYAYHEIGYDAAPSFSGSGYTIGGGGEVDLGRDLYLRGEYRYSDYGSAVRGQHFLLGLGLKL